tara:strand:- start:112 stop:369 length:258 start_codon:yes stop_codon:yes gene_type:complete
MQAISNYIVIEKALGQTKKVGGLILTEKTDVDNRYIKGTIISVGNFVEGLKEKDVIYYDKHAGHDITFDEIKYTVIRDRDVVLVE